MSCLSEPVSIQAGFGGHFNYGIIFVEGEVLCESLFVSFFFLKCLFGDWIRFSLFNTSLWPTLPSPPLPVSLPHPARLHAPWKRVFVAARASSQRSVSTWPLSWRLSCSWVSLLFLFMSLSTCQCVKTQVGSVSPFPFWILNKYLKLRQRNDTSVAVCFFEKAGGKFLAGLRGSGEEA